MSTPMDAGRIIALWPSPAEMAADAGVEAIAVRRWRERNRIPAKHDLALVEAAKKRRLPLSLHDLAVSRHGRDQLGHNASPRQPAAPSPSKGTAPVERAPGDAA